MEAPQTLRPPANWQDFETLCKRLWGEIWSCPEIQKNGRLGQEQSGVDIFGIPFGEDGYYGIQCKGKSEYFNNQFTQNEILDEIEKAKGFEPKLKKLYLATTACNDNKTQSFVRQKNLEHKSQGLFEIHLFCWETIVDLIDSNRQIHEWYVKNQNYKTRKSISFTFDDGSTEITANPKFYRNVINFINKGTYNAFNKANSLVNLQIKLNELYQRTTVNLSFLKVRFVLKNTGTDHLDEYKIFFEFDGELQEIADTNVTSSIPVIERNYYRNTYIWNESKTGKIVPKNGILVGDDSLKSEPIFIKPAPKDGIVMVKWKLISKDFKDSGELKINIVPELKRKTKLVAVDDINLERIEAGIVEDFIEYSNNKD